MSEAPTVSTDARPEAVIVNVTAHDLGEQNMTALRQAVADAQKLSPALPFIVNLATVKFVPSLTLGALVRMASEFRARRQRLIFVSLQRTVRDVVALTRLDRLLEVMDDEKAALDSLKFGE